MKALITVILTVLFAFVASDSNLGDSSFVDTEYVYDYGEDPTYLEVVTVDSATEFVYQPRPTKEVASTVEPKSETSTTGSNEARRIFVTENSLLPSNVPTTKASNNEEVATTTLSPSSISSVTPVTSITAVTLPSSSAATTAEVEPNTTTDAPSTKPTVDIENKATESPMETASEQTVPTTEAPAANEVITDPSPSTPEPAEISTSSPSSLKPEESKLETTSEASNVMTDNSTNPDEVSPAEATESSSTVDNTQPKEPLVESTPSPAVETSPSPSVADQPCPTGDELIKKVSKIIEDIVPNEIKLPASVRGRRIPLTLDNGVLIASERKVSGTPTCVDEGVNGKVYSFFLDMSGLRGSYDWKLFNLFGNNFSESVLLTLNKLRTEFVFKEVTPSSGVKRTLLVRTEVGSMEDLDIKVNIPEKIMQIRVVNRVMSYVTSRLTTFVVNRSKQAIAQDFKKAFEDEIKAKEEALYKKALIQ